MFSPVFVNFKSVRSIDIFSWKFRELYVKMEKSYFNFQNQHDFAMLIRGDNAPCHSLCPDSPVHGVTQADRKESWQVMVATWCALSMPPTHCLPRGDTTSTLDQEKRAQWTGSSSGIYKHSLFIGKEMSCKLSQMICLILDRSQAKSWVLAGGHIPSSQQVQILNLPL